MFAGALPVLTHEHQRDAARAERVFRHLDLLLLGATAAVAAGCAMLAAPVLRLVYGAPFAAAAPALFVVGIGLIPLLSNSGRKVFLYASGGERRVVRWSTVSVIAQVSLGAVLIPTLGSVGAAASLAAGEAMIWWPLRRTAKSDADVAQALTPVRQQT
jgi:O-antigen/teichoic acid export membrane protein